MVFKPTVAVYIGRKCTDPYHRIHKDYIVLGMVLLAPDQQCVNALLLYTLRTEKMGSCPRQHP